MASRVLRPTGSEPRSVMVTHLPMFLSAEGQVSRQPRRLRELAEFLTSVVVTGSRRLGGKRPGKVKCRVVRARRPCPGEIETTLAPVSRRLEWHCAVCGDAGEISGWAGTRWDRSKPARRGGPHTSSDLHSVVFGSTRYRGGAKTLKEMDDGIRRAVAERHRRATK
jgi:hypothetical protein